MPLADYTMMRIMPLADYTTMQYNATANYTTMQYNAIVTVQIQVDTVIFLKWKMVVSRHYK